LSWLVYLVAERRIHGVSIEDLREDIKHTEDQHKTALSITEFIEKKGDEEWADGILQDLGPWLMVQLADAANFFETTRKYVAQNLVPIYSTSSFLPLPSTTSEGNS